MAIYPLIKLPSKLGRPLHVFEAEEDLILLAQTIDDIVNVTQLTNLSVIAGGDIVATDTILQAFGKIQNEINNIITETLLTNLDTSTGGQILATDSMLRAFGRIRYALDNILNIQLTGFESHLLRHFTT